MKKIGLVILGMGVLLIGIFSFNKEENRVLVEEKLNNQNTSLVFMLEDKEGNYNISEDIPSGYSLNTSKSVCSNNTIPTWEDHKLYLNNLNKKGTSCYLYFDLMGAKDLILSNSKVNDGTPNFSQAATTDEGIYKTEDDWGESYYFRGAVTNNWVKFAGYYWRIIRINGDGSIRLIYNGTSTEATGEEAQIETSKFNNLYNNNAYVGYMYTSGQVHGLGTNSGIKDILDSWYQTNITNKGYGNKVSTEVGFCGDREPSTSASSSNGSGGTGTTTTYYGASIRLDINKTPTLKCKNSSDLYTINGSSKGNKALTNPVGLITADEVAMAGGVYGQINQNYYLYTNQIYWTMSPYYFSIGSSSSWASVSVVNSIGNLGYNCVDNSRGGSSSH